MEAKNLRQPYISALQKIAKHVNDNTKKVDQISKDTKVCPATIQMALLGRIVKFDTAEKIIQWGIDHKVIKE